MTDLTWNAFRPIRPRVELDTRNAIAREPEFDTAWQCYSIERNMQNVTHEQGVTAMTAIAERLEIDVALVASVATDAARSEDLYLEHQFECGWDD